MVADAPDWATVRLRGVGIDVGSATSHLVFSTITMAKAGERFVPVERTVTYASPILRTPYTAGTTIDLDALGAFVAAQYAAAGVDPAEVDCGAVILTGTALDRANARLAADLVAGRSGRFVAVSAGDTLEAVLAAHGAGAVGRSAAGEPVLAVDIGGGTTKVALCADGAVTATTALDVGGRLIAVDDADRVVRLEPAGRRVAERLGIPVAIGSVLPDADREAIARHMVAEVLAVVRGDRSWLLRGDALAATSPVLVLSGGVAEYLSDGPTAGPLGDLGPALAAALRDALDAAPGLVTRPAANAIRATALGAALFTVQLSGDTIHTSRPGVLPLRDVPVGVAGADLPASVQAAVRLAPRGSPVAVAVPWTGSATLDRLRATAEAIVAGAGELSGPLVLVCDDDVGRLLGRHVAALLPPGRDLVSIDGVDLRDLDFIDIGTPEGRSGAVPVTVKSLIFPAADPKPADEPAPPRASRGPRGGTFSSLRTYNYRLYFIGQGISVAGNWMQNVAIAWLVLSLSGSAVILGIVTAARFVPLVLLGPWGGLVADRSDKRRLLTATQVAMGVLALLLAILSWAHRASLGALLAIVVALGLVNVLDGPVRQAIIANLVARDEIANAVTLNSVVMNGSRIIGPSIGGALIATLGIAPCFFVNALSFGAVIVSLAAMRGAEMYPSQRETRSPGQIRAGLRYVTRTPTVLGPLVMVLVAGTFAWEFPVSLPLVTVRTFHADAAGYGAVMSCLGAGSIAGGLWVARLRLHDVRALSWSGVAWGLTIVLAAVSPTMPVFYVTIATVGAGAIAFNSAAKTLLQLAAEPVMRGRVMALWSIAWQGSAVIGAPIVGAVAGAWGARYGLGIGGAATLLVAGYYLLARARRAAGRVGEREPVAAGAATPGQR